MPRKPIDYSKTIMYHFICNDKSITDSYVGHTTDMTRRKCNHKSCCHNENDQAYNFKLYQNIRKNGGWSNWEMRPLEIFSCENVIQARIREQYWIDELQAKLNMLNTIFKKEDYQKKYNEDHKEFVKEQKNEKFTCECGGRYTKANRAMHFKSQKHINSVPNV